MFLIADDNPAKQMFLARIVKRAGYTDVAIASTTEEAIALIDANPQIDAAFIDYEIPSEEGPAVIRHLREKNPSARIALVTSEERYEEKGRAAGADAFVCTTYPENEVIARIENLLLEWQA
jgi:CheY-like chemotaxis protein